MAEIDLILDRVEKLAVQLGEARSQAATAEASFSAARFHAEELQRAPRISGQDVIWLLEAIAEGKKIEAIKAHRQMTGYGLKESKDHIERVIDGALQHFASR